MQDPSTAPSSSPHPWGAPREAQPYGLLGLVVSLVLILIAAAVLAGLLAAAAVGVAMAVFGYDQTVERLGDLAEVAHENGEAWRQLLIAGTLLQDAVLSGVVLLAARIRGGEDWRDLVGWHRWSVRRWIGPILGLLALAMVYNVAVSAVLEHVHPQSKDWTPTPSGPLWIGVFVVLAMVFAPITEELLFRGWIYTSLRRSFGVAAALLVSSALFALAHWDSSHLEALVIFPVGMALGFVRERVGSIGASMLFHGLFNGLAVLVLVFGR